METTPKINIPVEHSEGSAPSEAHEVFRLASAVDDLEGPVVVGGRSGSDCFRYSGGAGIQAGQPDPKQEPLVFEDGEFQWEPKKLKW